MLSKRTLFLLYLILGVILAACGEVDSSPPSPPPSVAPGETAQGEAGTPTVTAPPPTREPTSTLPSPLAVLLAAPGSDSALVSTFETGLQPELAAAGFRWEVRSSLSPSEMVPELRLVVVLPPDPGLANLLTTSSSAQFLAIGLTGFQPAANLSLVGPEGFRSDQASFIAGVAAALITPDWRVGVVGPADTQLGRAARQGFLNGAVYFCGLCLPYHGPNVDYPVYQDLPSAAGELEIQAAVQGLSDLAVKTVYLSPGVGSPELFLALSQAGIKFISSETVPQDFSANRVAVVQPNPLPAVLEFLPSILAGEGSFSREMAFTLQDVNPTLLSEGRRLYLQEVIDDLQAGYIDTGVEPLAGDS